MCGLLLRSDGVNSKGGRTPAARDAGACGVPPTASVRIQICLRRIQP